MKQELEDAGYWPETTNEPKCEAATPSGKKEKPKKQYATIHANDKELPLRIKGLASGDKLLMTAVVNVDEMTSMDPEKDYEKASKRFRLSIEKCSFEKTLAKKPSEMTDEELNAA
jgi:hypothetical protein